MALRNYLCSKCGTPVKKDSSPTTTGCPEGGGHSWHNLGDVGDNSYQCKKCSVVINAKSNPTLSGCPDGGNHSWHKL